MRLATMAENRRRVGELLRRVRRAVVPDPNGMYTFLGISAEGRGFFKKPESSGAALRPGTAFEVAPGDFVYSRLFAWQGSFEIATDSEVGCVVSGEFPTYVAVTADISLRWLRYWFLSQPGLEAVVARSSGTTSGSRNRLREDRFEAIEILLPPMDEQRRVAARIDEIKSIATELGQRTARAVALDEALIVSAAVRPDLNYDAKVSADWEHTPLGDVLRPSTAQVPVDLAEQYMIAGIYSFGRGLIDRGPISGSDTSYTRLTRLSTGDIVVSKLNGWEGAVAVVDPPFAGYHVSSEYPTFTPDRDRLLPEFFAGVAQAPSFWDDLDTSARGSMVRRRRINAKEFLATRVWLPPVEIQEHVARVIAGASEISQARAVATRRINALVPAALNEAFAGLS